MRRRRGTRQLQLVYHGVLCRLLSPRLPGEARLLDAPDEGGVQPREPARARPRLSVAHDHGVASLDCLPGIESLESGDARLPMGDGTRVPCGWRYRAGLRGQGAEAV